MCKCLFSEVTVQAVTDSDNKAVYCHTPVLQRHRPFRGRCLYCQTHHFFHRLVCRKHLRFLIAWRITLFSDPMAFVSDSDDSYRWNEVDKRFSVDDTPNEPNRFGWVGEIDQYGYFSENNENICALYNQIKPRNQHKYY